MSFTAEKEKNCHFNNLKTHITCFTSLIANKSLQSATTTKLDLKMEPWTRKHTQVDLDDTDFYVIKLQRQHIRVLHYHGNKVLTVSSRLNEVPGWKHEEVLWVCVCALSWCQTHDSCESCMSRCFHTAAATDLIWSKSNAVLITESLDLPLLLLL